MTIDTTINTNGLLEIPEMGGGAFKVWRDRADLGLVFMQPFTLGAGVTGELAQMTVPQVNYSTFKSITTLPVGTKFIAPDRAMSEWVWDGAYWVCKSNFSGTILLTGNRNVSPDDQRAMIVNQTASVSYNMTVNGQTLPDGFRCTMITTVAAANSIGIQAGSNMALDVFNKTGSLYQTNGKYAVMELVKVQSDPVTDIFTVLGYPSLSGNLEVTSWH